MQTNDKLVIGGHEFNSRFILGSGKYSMDLIEAAVKKGYIKESSKDALIAFRNNPSDESWMK